MTLPEIYNLNRSGEVEKAYAECKKLLDQYPNDRNVRIQMAWCLKSISEQASKNKDVDRIVEILHKLSMLNLPEIGELSMANRFSWDILQLLRQLKNETESSINAADKIFEEIKNLQFIKPNKYYTILADAFLNVKGPQDTRWHQIMVFFDWWGFDNFMPEDYNKIPLSNGKSKLSIVERAYNAYSKSLLQSIEDGDVDVQKIEAFIDRLTDISKRHPEYQYPLYYKSKLALAINKKEDALDAIRPFLKRKQNEYWAWDVLSDIADDIDLKLSCWCRALLSKTDTKYLVRIRLKLAKLMHELGYDSNASYEIQEYYKTSQLQGWKISQEAIKIAQQEWYQNTQPEESNIDFYKIHLRASEESLFWDMPKIAIFITHYNKEKGMCNFITQDYKQGFFSTKKLGIKIKENDVLLVRLEKAVAEGEISKILTVEKKNNVTEYVNLFFKKIDGDLNLKQGCDFGFVDDIYISQDLIKNDFVNGSPVIGTAIISYNKKKQTFGWRAITLKPKVKK